MLDLEVAKLHTRTPIKVPVIVTRSKKDGPVVLLMAGVHGDEVNGVAIVRELIRRKMHRPKLGTIICIPVFNIFGYLIQTREFPDGRDLNRMFPGSANGSLASQFAHQFIQEIAPLADIVMDFHTGGADRINAAQLRCDFNKVYERELAEVFNAPFTVHSGTIPKSLRDALHSLGKPVLLFEGGKSRHLDTQIIQHGVDGCIRVLNYLGMQNASVESEQNSRVITNSKWIRAPYSGMFIARVNNGNKVLAKEVIGEIQDPFGGFERRVKAPHDGYIFCVNAAPIVNKGDALFHISIETTAVED